MNTKMIDLSQQKSRINYGSASKTHESPMKAQRAKLNLSMVYEDAPQKKGYITKAFFSKKQAK